MCATALAISACASQPKAETPAEALLARLSEQISENRIMFGHQDSFLYGHSWKIAADATSYDKSDIKDVADVYPALYGMDLGGIELDSPTNIDNNDFNKMRAAAVAHYLRGGVVTFSWHPRNPLTGGDTWDTSSKEVVASILPGGEKHEFFMGWLSKAADFLGSIKDAEGNFVADNFYCIAAQRNVYDFEESTWYDSPITSYSDLRFAFAQPEADVTMEISYADGVYTVVLKNNSPVISYMNILKAKDAKGYLLVPAYWSDNFFPLLPGQEKTITCRTEVKAAAIELDN